MSVIEVSLLSAWPLSWGIKVQAIWGPTRQALKRAELPKQIVPVVFDPVFRELLALEPADDDHCPPRRAVGCGNPLPLLTLRGMPGAPPHGLVPREHRLWRSLQPRRPYRRT